jgi:transcription elongation factor Elf1
MGKYRKKELPKKSIKLRSDEKSKDNGVLGLQQISSVSANLRVGLIVKRKNANRLKACKICGRKFGSNWA